MLPQDFTRIKHKLETTTALASAERQEWLGLLPRMTPPQLRELDRILSAAPPAAPTHPPRLTSADALRALSVADLRRAPSVYKFLTNLASQFRALHAVEAEAAFEQSELYKAYVADGVKLMEGAKTTLTREEVEAITDFRANFGKLRTEKLKN